MTDHFQSSISFRKDGQFVGGVIFGQPKKEPLFFGREQVMFPDGSVRCVYMMRRKVEK